MSIAQVTPTSNKPSCIVYVYSTSVKTLEMVLNLYLAPGKTEIGRGDVAASRQHHLSGFWGKI